MGKEGDRLKKGSLAYLNVMSVPQLMRLELFPSPRVGEIRHILSFWGPFLLTPIQKWSHFKRLLYQTCCMCGDSGRLSRGNGPRRIRILGF